MNALQLSEIWCYPVKSMRGTRYTSIEVDSCGPAFDRHWMLVDPQGQFITQRQFPQMALIQAELHNNQLSFHAANDSYSVNPSDSFRSLQVKVWRDQCEARLTDSGADQWLSKILGRPCHLVEMPQSTIRQVDQNYANPGDQVGFADAFPFMLIAQASLDHLNQKLVSPIGIQRFRPNLVVTGCSPHAEDSWKAIRIGDMHFRVAKPCSRCIIPSIDPETAERSQEPLPTLRAYRQRDNKIYFGQNLVHESAGYLTEGMPVEIITA